jgi:homogentisate 1,2-dioxygenase
VAYYRSAGELPRTRHTQYRRPDGGLYVEELMGQEGFSYDSSLLYHRHAPTDIVDAVAVVAPDPGWHDNAPLLPRHLRTHRADRAGDVDPVTGRVPLLGNADVEVSYVAATVSSDLYRNAVGDELVYVEAGTGRVETVFGPIDVRPGDHVVLPTSTTHRWVPAGPGPLRLLVMAASGHVAPPKRYLSVRGQFLEHSPYCERDLRGPGAPAHVDGRDVPVLVRHRAGTPTGVAWTRYTYDHHPFDVVGWDGCLYPYALNVEDFQPITGRVHQPPPVHQTFEGPHFVTCAFVPRLFDYHPLAIPAPYHHANVDSDEVLFYSGGEFMSRKGAGIEQGSITLHPAGFVHGPQPGSVEASLGATATEELAVMLDTFRPLRLSAAASGGEDHRYPWTWSGRGPTLPA